MLKAKKKEEGQAMVEFALVLPILLLVVCGIIDFGWMFFNQLTLQNATNIAARTGVVSYQQQGSSKFNYEKFIEDKVKDNLINNMDEYLNVDISYLESNPLESDLEVKATTKIKFLTPVMGTLLRKNTWDLKASVVMRIES